MLYILPRVVLQVKASLYYKTINNKTKKKLILSFPVVTACSWSGMGGARWHQGGPQNSPRLVSPPALRPQGCRRWHGGGGSDVRSSRTGHGSCRFCFIDAKSSAAARGPSAPAGGVGEALRGAQRALAATGRAAFWYC